MGESRVRGEQGWRNKGRERMGEIQTSEEPRAVTRKQVLIWWKLRELPYPQTVLGRKPK